MSAQSAVKSTIAVIAFLCAAFLSIVALTAFDSGVGPLFLVATLMAIGLAFMGKNKVGQDKSSLTNTAGGAIAGGIFVVAVIAGALSLVMWAYNSLSSPGDKKAAADFSSMAHIKCNDYVKDRLKAPSTAEFPFLADRITKVSDGHYLVESHVDAQNSFGAKLRRDYYCDIELVGEYSGSKDSWKLKTLRLAE